MSHAAPTGLRERTAALWQHIRLLFGVLGLVRFQLILLLIGLVLVLFVGQARDLLIYYGLKCSTDFGGDVILFIATAMGAALSTWYSARVMFRFRFVREGERLASEPRIAPSDQSVLPWLKHHLPRWLGASVFLILILGLATLWDEARFQPVALLVWLSGALAVFVIFVNVRRRVFRLPSYREQKTHNNLTDFADLPASTRRWYWFLLLTNAVVMVAAVRAPLAMASLIGPGGVLMLGAGLAVVVGSTLVYLSNWFRFPVVWVALISIALFSLTNENHAIRLCPEMTSTDAPEVCEAVVDTRPEVADALDDWVAYRAPRVTGDRLPVFIVATEGGGIRAAYWTAAVLGALHDQSETPLAFDELVLALSGVSGGSLGASVFAATTADRNDAARAVASATLERDFLGPALVTLLFPDLLQRFLPVPVFDDRAMTLERSFETNWRWAAGTDRFAQPLMTLYTGPAPTVPWLLLNSTLVETGERMVYAPVRLGASSGALDGVAIMGDAVPLSTAAHNSARFPYVSPAGVVRRSDNRPDDQREHWTRIVDGGYVDNAGATSALELLHLVRRERAALHRRHGVWLEPFVIQITNAEANAIQRCNPSETAPSALSEPATCHRRRFLPETLSPLISTLKTRIGNTEAAIERLAVAAGDDRYVRVPLRDNGVAHPLGWMLASPSRQDMQRQIDGYGAVNVAQRPQRDVRGELERVLSFSKMQFAGGERE
ncbi:MAG: hypothetical protein AAF610_00045 [Pseudomonadota bacterium]